MKKILAIILASLMIFSLVACGVEEDANNEPKKDATENQTENTSTEKSTKKEETKEEKLPTSEDEIFKYIIDAYDTSINYSSDLTAVGTTTAKHISNEESQSKEEAYNMISTLSFNGTDKTVYREDIYEEDGAKEKMYGKTFVHDDKLYMYTESIDLTTNESEIELERINDTDKKRYQSLDIITPFYYITETYQGIKLADSINELKNAVNTALPTILKVKYNDSIGNADPSISSAVSAKASDGIYTLVIDITSSAEVTEDGATASLETNISHTLSAKDGKIIDYKAVIYMSTKATQGSTVIMESIADMSIGVSYEYSFAKDQYNALEVDMPNDTSDIPVMNPTPTKYEDVNIEIYVNGVEELYISLPTCNTPQEALNAIISNLDTEKGNVKLFADEAMTQEITESNVTKELILSLTEIYAELTPKSDYALVIESHSYREDYSKPYKIVIPTLYLLGISSDYSEYSYQNIFDPGYYGLDEEYISNDSCEILINGVKYDSTEETITIEAGKTYKIEYIKIASDKDFN